VKTTGDVKGMAIGAGAMFVKRQGAMTPSIRQAGDKRKQKPCESSGQNAA
jgi:hypothetical protein